jgi:peptidoglycan/LPS O-acetylase OafA/YrhL
MPPFSSAPPHARRLDLDVVRGVAIVLALGWHFSPEFSGNVVLDVLQWPGHQFGWAGVDLFFVLSGFLMGQLVLRERARTGGFDGRRFTARRMLRLWPVLYAFLAVYSLVGHDPLSAYLWQNALHVQNYAGTSLAHLWSLAVEEHFYLLLALLFPLFARRRGPVRLLVGLLVGVLVLCLALRGIGVASGVSDVRLQWRTHFRMDSLAAGVLLAVVRVHAPSAFDRLLRWRWLWAATTAGGVWVLASVGNTGPVGATLGYTVAYLTGAAFLLLLHDAAWVPRAGLLTRPLAAVGRYSYGIYIWHLFAAEVALRWLPGLDGNSSGPLAQLVKYAAAILAGVVVTRVLERPVLRLRERLVPAAPRPAPVTTAPASSGQCAGSGGQGAATDDGGDAVLQRGHGDALRERSGGHPGDAHRLQLVGRQ